jgi:hypothetical protein
LFLIFVPLSFLVVRAECGGLSTAAASSAAFGRDDDFFVGVEDVFVELGCDFFKLEEFSLAARVVDFRGSAVVRSMRVLESLSLVRSVASRAAICPLSVS